MKRSVHVAVVTAVLLAASPAGTALAEAPDERPRAAQAGGVGDATVIAVMDYAPFSPYHWDLSARHMPQALDDNEANDLPLDQPPHEWLPGYPAPGTTGHTFREIDLTLSHEYPEHKRGGREEKAITRAELTGHDAAIWNDPPEQPVRPGRKGLIHESTYDWKDPRVNDVNVHWFTGTKILAALEFGSLDNARPRLEDPTGEYEASGLNRTAPRGIDKAAHGAASDGHAVGTTSASVGNLHGACPECLLVFLEVDVGGVSPSDTQQTDTAGVEQALSWALDQPWIDAVVMPGTPSATPFTRERLYLDSDVDRQRTASAAGKTLFFSAGNGHEPGSGLGTTTTLQSSMQGPDWVVTVSGTHTQQDRDQTPSGYGKPADVSGTASVTSTAFDAPEVGGSRPAFAATSLGVAVVAGVYGKALYELRAELPGASRGRRHGEVASGPPGCNDGSDTCELVDGRVTADELRKRLLLGATPTDAGSVQRILVQHDGEGDTLDTGRTFVVPEPPEADFAGEGHGTYQGRCPHDTTAFRGAGGSRLATTVFGDPCTLLTTEQYRESDELQDVIGPILGTRAPKTRRPGEAEWFVVDSWCRQQLWGSWDGGFWNGQALPEADRAFPLRTAYEQTCRGLSAAFPTLRPKK